MTTALASGPHAKLANDVDNALRGQEAGKRSLELIATGVAVPDELLHGLAQAAKNWGDAGARGYLRVLQKRLERAT